MRYWWILISILITAAFIFIVNRGMRGFAKSIRKQQADETELERMKALEYRHQLEMEQVIGFFATSMAGQRTVEGMLWDVARNCISRLGFEDCVIYITDPVRGLLQQKAAWGPKTTEENKIVNPIDIPIGKGIVGTVAATGIAEIAADTSADPRYIIDDQPRLSEITVPIVRNGAVIGVIDSEHPSRHFYNNRHLQILTTIAALCADRIDKIQAEEKTREKEREVLQLSNDLLSSQLSTLRAQMNPHFIFNALNSIQQFILDGNATAANKYLVKFSRLQRDILHYSDQQFLTIEKELEMLEPYLQIEQLRFSNFGYQIHIDDDLDPAEVKIPCMILQPAVENAIWHGLMPITGDRVLRIAFESISDDMIQCLIEDNGVGRKVSGTYKPSAHRSTGLHLVRERLAMLSQQFGQPFEMRISDLDPGTRVAIIVPSVDTGNL